MENRRKKQIFLSLFVLFDHLCGKAELITTYDQNDNLSIVEEVHAGVIVNMGSLEGKILQSCISMALSDFYTLHYHYKTRVILHARDSRGEPLHALSVALDLLETAKVEVMLGAQSSMEAKFLAELGDKTEVPLISFHASFSSSSNKYPFVVQVTHDETSQAKGIAAIIDLFKWRNIILIYEDSDDWRDSIPYMVDHFQENRIHIVYKSAISASTKGHPIIDDLHKLMALRSTIFIVHMSEFLLSHLFLHAERLGMMGEGYAWIMTVKSMNLLHRINASSVKESMQGVIGLKPYIPASNELDDFTWRLRKAFLIKEPTVEVNELSAFDVWAYDVAWSLARAAERTRVEASLLTRNAYSRLNLMDSNNIGASTRSSILLEEILQSRFEGLSGEFRIINGKLFSDTFEIINVIGRGGRRVGFWTSGKFTKDLYPASNNNRRHLSSTNDLETIIWPGGSATTPKGRMLQMNGKKLRIGVPSKSKIPQLVGVRYDQPNAISFTGFCIDVFLAAIQSLQYKVEFEFIPFVDGSYNDLVYQVYLQNYDAAVGDITITANRSLYVDFTIPYTDLGVGMVGRKDNKNMWIFLKPLTTDLWFTSAGFFILTGFVVWLIERPTNYEFQGSLSQQIGMIFWFSFSTLVFAHREKLVSNLSRFVVLVWMFVVLILSSSYTATLTSMMTVQQIQLNSNENYYIGYKSSAINRGILSNLNFKDSNLKPLNSIEDYANALMKGSKNGGVSAIIDEIPYLKVFLGNYSTDYTMIGSIPKTNGFAFVFPKGSPLVPEISREIARLREEKRLLMLENQWFNNQPPFMSDDTSNPLTVKRFAGLFLISGTSSALALAIFPIFMLHKNWHFVKICFFRIRGPLESIKNSLSGKVSEFIKKYISIKISNRTGGTNVINPDN